ncbi:MAG: carboxypeptidase-like regulatory domain-containing protein [Bacteroidaceae bacterium]|nr:carboxypeptidase-like regulatory domain-containing protein [Bacteroidaceae bacterium]
MNVRAIFALIISIMSWGVIFAQQTTDTGSTVTISGTISDENHQPLEFVTVKVEGQGGTISDLNGNYSTTVESRDSMVITYSMVGYQIRKRTLHSPRGKITINITLPSSDYELQGVTVKEMRRQTGQNVFINSEQSKLMPSTTGNAVEELIGTQAGVSSHNELSSQYNVRGGSFDENSVYVNGIEIFRPLLVRSGQQEGLSFINPDMVENINFSSGGFEAKYGDKMSSVLDITYKKPRKFEATAQASLLGASAFVGFSTKHFSMMNSIRYKTNRSLVGSLDTKGEYDPSFTDYQTCINWEPNKRWNIGFIGNFAQNKYRFKPENRETKFGTMENVQSFKVYFDGQERDLFRTYFGALSITRNINNHNRVTFQASAFHSQEEVTYDIAGEYWLDAESESQSLGVGTYMEHARNYLSSHVQTYSLKGHHELQNGHRLSWGAEVRNEKFKESSREWEMRDSAGYSLPHHSDKLELIYSLNYPKQTTKSVRYSAYLQDNYKIVSPVGLWSLNAGIRASYWDWNEELIVSPRASVGLIPAFNEDFTFRFATGLYYQAPFYKEFRDTTTTNGVTTITLNKDIKSQRSIHFVLAGDYKFRMLDRNFKFTAELYYKLLANLVPYNIDNVRTTYYGKNQADGYAAGIDLKLYGEFVPGTDSWVTLSIMKTEEKINGVWVPRPTDQRLNMSLFFTDYFPNTDRWKMSLRMNYADGLPFGPPHGGREQQVFRAPAYKRVDLGMSYRLLNNEEKQIRTGVASYFKNIWLGVDVFNLFNFNNTNSYYWITDINGQQSAIPNYLTSRQFNLRVLCEF